jgi:hypothetical protein
MTPQEENFAIANRYLGWGEPDESLWFIGLEEASEWSVADLEKFRQKPESISGFALDPDLPSLGRKGLAIRALTCQIAQPLSQDVDFHPLLTRAFQVKLTRLFAVG